MTFVSAVRAGCGLVVALAVMIASAEEPRRGSMALVSVSARSRYQPVSERMLSDGESTSPETENASYLQYEPQNVPLATDPMPLITELPPVVEPGLAPATDLPPVVPYSTQFFVTWNSGTGDDLGMTSLDLREVLAFPRMSGFLVTPGFAVHLLTGPDSVDLPGALYENWLEFRWLRPINDQWTADVAVTPGLFTDYNNVGSDAIRIQARAIGLWSCDEDLQLALGFLYLDREDIAAMPMAGLIWTPSDDCKAELLFPRPRVLYRLSGDDVSSRWIYIGGEFGGGSWAIERNDIGPPPKQPRDDVVTYSVWRFLVGFEAKKKTGFAPRVEAGFNFNRSVEFKSGNGDFDPGNTALLRVGGSF
jgi:hypothetical protein